MEVHNGGGDEGIKIIGIVLVIALVIGIFAYNSCGREKLGSCYNEEPFGAAPEGSIPRHTVEDYREEMGA